MWQLTWRLENGTLGAYPPTADKECVEAWVKALNKSNPLMDHWMVEVEDIEPDTEDSVITEIK